MVRWFALYLEEYLMDNFHNWDIGSMWCKDLPLSLNVCGSVTYISWFSDFVFYREDNLMDLCCTGDIDSVWHKHWPETIYVGQRPIFHGPVILFISWCYLRDKCHNWKTGSMWCKDFPHNMYVLQWPKCTFHGPVIPSYILKTFWRRNVVLKIMIRCDIKFFLQIYI